MQGPLKAEDLQAAVLVAAALAVHVCTSRHFGDFDKMLTSAKPFSYSAASSAGVKQKGFWSLFSLAEAVSRCGLKCLLSAAHLNSRH